jgi:hypothetical protein
MCDTLRDSTMFEPWPVRPALRRAAWSTDRTMCTATAPGPGIAPRMPPDRPPNAAGPKRPDNVQNELDRPRNHPDGAADYLNGAKNHLNGAADYLNGAKNQLNGAADYPNGAKNHLNGAADHPNGAKNHLNGAMNHLNRRTVHLPHAPHVPHAPDHMARITPKTAIARTSRCGCRGLEPI